MGELRLNEPQRRAVGVRLRAVGEAVETLRRAGLDPGRLDAIDRLLGETAAAARTPPPQQPQSIVSAMVAEILIGAAEIRPSHLRRYGEIDEQTAQELTLVSTRLTQLADALEVFEPAAAGDVRAS
jgi:hypothetical protein